ncbi:MAG: helix-turn-helix transcriptional regulator [Oscillospiraceae bacterium]|nr:helix-turn-helix transcriptional regulator [Oscillospiraceae bacterium]
MDVSERIFALSDKQYSEQKDFGKAIGVVQSVVSAWRTGKSKSYMKRLPQVAKALGTTPEYLLTGKEADTQQDISENPSKQQLQAAFWGGEKDLTQEEKDAMWSDVEKFAAFLAEQKRRERGSGTETS